LDFCYRAVEIWFAQIGLDMDYLVEILDGQYVIFKIQSIPADGCNAIGIQLRLCRTYGK
jgi:hypothetical protein